MEVRIGERVDFVGESAQTSPTYKWVVKKGDDILATQSARNFNYKFNQQGEYAVNLTATSDSVVENTTIHVLAGERYSRPAEEDGGAVLPPGVSPLYLRLETLPPKDFENNVTLLGDSGRVQFLMSESSGDILEYRVDKNIFTDSDGDGTANNDIDNADDDSYLTGSVWTAEYRQDESAKIAAEVTLVDKNGKKAKQQVGIRFRERRATGDPAAAWEILPAPAEDGLVHLYKDPHTVSFYARPSEGNILEYRIDKNIFTDSDGDGDPANDIDNLNDISFKTGDVFEVEYGKTDEQIIAQLIVVGEGGKGSRIQKGLVFGDKPAIPAPPPGEVSGIRLTADKAFVVKGDTITFTVEGLQQAADQYTFAWDFDGDGETDKETDGINTVEHIYDFPGVPLAMVTVTDDEGNSADYTFEMFVKDRQVTKADFDFEADGTTVRFTDQSTVSMDLADKSLDYQWSFGDTDPASYETQKDQIGRENPVYTYSQPGTYIVTLTITDAAQVTDSKSAEVEVLEGAVGEREEEAVPDEEDGESSLFVRLLKFALYLILIVVGLALLIIGGALIFFKIQHPDLTFEELVDELKAKLLTKLGASETEGFPPSETPPQPPEETPPQPPEETPPSPPEPTPPEPSAPPAEEPPAEPEKPLGAGEGKTPPWMKEKDVIEGEVDESPSEAPAPQESSSPKPPPAETPEPPAEEKPAGPAEKPAEKKEKEAPGKPEKDSGPSSGKKPKDKSKKPPAPPAGGGKKPSGPPTGETDAPASEKGPVPDWLKGV